MEAARSNESKEMRKNCRMKSIVWLQGGVEYIWDGFAEIIDSVWRCLARSEKSRSSCSCGYSFCILVNASQLRFCFQVVSSKHDRKLEKRLRLLRCQCFFITMWDLASGANQTLPARTRDSNNNKRTKEYQVRAFSRFLF